MIMSPNFYNKIHDFFDLDDSDLEPMAWTNFSLALLCYAEIERSDWMVQVTWLLWTNPSVLIQHGYTKLKFVYDFRSM